MKHVTILALMLFTAAGCTTLHTRMVRQFSGSNPYKEDPFWVRYLAPDNPSDQRIRATLDALSLDPWSAPLHNQLGELLSNKGLPKQAETEFDRAVASDKRFYPAWYNLGLIRENRGNEPGAIRALKSALEYKPGHAAAHFQLGLLYERRGRIDAAIDHYADAIRINPQLLSVKVNPRIVDSRLIDRAILRLYPFEHSRASLNYEPTPPSYPSQPTVVIPGASTPPAPAGTAEPTPPGAPAPMTSSSAPSSEASVGSMVTTSIPTTATAPQAPPPTPAEARRARRALLRKRSQDAPPEPVQVLRSPEQAPEPATTPEPSDATTPEDPNSPDPRSDSDQRSR